MTSRVLTAVAGSALLLAATFGPVQAAPASTPGATGSRTTPPPLGPKRLLERSLHGENAVAALGTDIGSAAERNDLSVPALRSLLRSDRAAWVDPRGDIYYVDPVAAPAEPSAEAAAAYPDAQTFLLHSRPGSSRKVYLDFDGQVVSGTAWNNSYSVSGTDKQPAFDTDGAPTTFSAGEHGSIQSIWARVSEDFAPFDVDVTTEAPTPEALRRDDLNDRAFGIRALITPSDEASRMICGACGGVAYLDVFDEVNGPPSHKPAWVFPHLLGNDTKAIAEATTHEVGHTLGLDHDGIRTQGYTEGHGAWAPIMGAGYERPITQWSKGEYSGATNRQDDLAVMTAGGIRVRGDDHGDTRTAATSMGEGPTASRSGVVGTRADRDRLSLDLSCAGSMTVRARPAGISPNLDIGLTVYAPDGTVLATANPTSAGASRDTATGLAATATLRAGPGTFSIAVDGVGARSAATSGYSDYASLGTYTVDMTGCREGGPGAPGIGAAKAGTTGGSVTATAAWAKPSSDGGSAINGYRVTALRIGSTGAVLGRSVSGLRPASSRSLAMALPRAGQYRFTVTALTSLGASPASARSNWVAGR